MQPQCTAMFIPTILTIIKLGYAEYNRAPVKYAVDPAVNHGYVGLSGAEGWISDHYFMSWPE
jgi:hypothetical protein